MKLVKKETIRDKYECWDLTVERYHNYMVEGVVVHNSNCRTGISYSVMEDGAEVYEWKSGSHNLKRKEPLEEDKKSNIYWYASTLDSVRKMIEFLHNENDGNKNVILYGEVYGRVRGGHKSMHYGCPNSLNFAAFAIKKNGKYVDWDEFVSLCEKYEVPVVPVLGIIPYKWEDVASLATGKSVLAAQNGADHMREGVVVLPLKERNDPLLGRVTTKVLNPDYLLLKSKSADKGEVSDYADV